MMEDDDSWFKGVRVCLVVLVSFVQALSLINICSARRSLFLSAAVPTLKLPAKRLL